jgi:uncharacterized protein
MPLPKSFTAPNDLTDSEFARLDELLVDAPARLYVGDAVMLDGYLCGVLVQPTIVPQEQWLPHIFDIDDGVEDDEIDKIDVEPAPSDKPVARVADAAWLADVIPLILKRYASLNRKIVEEGSFDPFILEFDEDAASDSEADIEAESDDMLADLPPVSRALAPWVFGFQLACTHVEGVLDSTDDAVLIALARLFRHLPPADADMAALIATMNEESPIETLDEGIDELVACVVDLSDLMSNERYHVDTVRRETPKVGRNDPCPCGSGKKFKQCHGAG